MSGFEANRGEENRPKACMVVFSYYPNDPRVRRASEALVDGGFAVDVFCLRGDGESARENIGGVGVHRLPVKRRREGALRYLWQYAAFLFMAGGAVAVSHFKQRYQLVHVHNMPDLLVLAGLLPRIAGARLIHDLHDPVPEVFMAKYDISEDHAVVRVCRFCERFSIAVADRVLTTNEAFRKVFVERGAREDKLVIVMNSPDERIFRAPETPAALPDTKGRSFRLMYHGTVVRRHGLDVALQALEILRGEGREADFEVYGPGDFASGFLALRSELGLESCVAYHGWVPLEQIAAAIPGVDLGIVPNARTSFTEINLPTRIFEFLRMGRPVVAPRTRGILDYFGERDLYYFEPGDPKSLAEAIAEAMDDPAERERRMLRGHAVYGRHRWSGERKVYLQVVRDLVGEHANKEAAL